MLATTQTRMPDAPQAWKRDLYRSTKRSERQHGKQRVMNKKEERETEHKGQTDLHSSRFTLYATIR